MTDFKHLVSADTAPHVEAGPTSLPERIGRYRVERLLGKGGFGLVFLAHDEQLKRAVAVKVPHAERISGPDDAKEYLAEAQTVASLDHPTIVPVYDVGSTTEFPCYIVSKFIEGTNLAEKIKEARLSFCETAELVGTVAEALQYAHKQGLVHRDVKPGNILIDKSGRPFVVDFGLALQEEDVGKGPRYAGTPGYMSPEQARGEGHRVDGRSDIFSLGVVFYELLTGRRPFRAGSREDLLDEIISHEPRPPRQYDEAIPKELERICLKMLSKRTTERYTTAKDLSDDLRIWLVSAEEDDKRAGRNVAALLDTETVGITPPATPHSDSQPIKIVPKGLRSFDEHDSDFFLELLPGPRDRDGLPDSIRFWKTRIEETDPDKTFSVGLIYGPSGCGKTSMVKAGLLPRLQKDVIPVYIEATAEETESRLLNGLRKRCPALSENLNLKDTLAHLRRGQGIAVGSKVVIVLDQFEQWLHVKNEQENSELVQSLRQCDGGHVQCIVMVRDDFWLAVSRFMKELEVRLLDGQNSALADLFDLDHARRVLAAFGRAFGKLPEHDLSNDQKQFLQQAVAGLAEDGKIVCVRLALFAEMMKGRAWTPATLKEVGGTKGIGVTFLEETFSASTAPPEHRLHQKAARAVLKALLPDSGTDIKGHMKSYDDLLDASNYTSRRKDFADLIQILDSELRLITPTDPEGAEAGKDVIPSAAGQKFYQLTHDYLVPSLRDWLTRKQKETRRGRAELRLAEQSALWNAKPENRRLPSVQEYVRLRLLTHKRNWTEPQHRMMRAASRRTMEICIGLLALSVVTIVGARKVQDQQYGTYANALVEALLAANTADVEGIIAELREYPTIAVPRLEVISATRQPLSLAERQVYRTYSDKEKLNASLALTAFNPSRVDYLAERLIHAAPQNIPVIVRTLEPYSARLTDQFWRSAKGDSDEHRLRAAAALAQFAPTDNQWEEVNSDVARALVSVPTVESKQWIDMLQAVAARLTEPLEVRYRDHSAIGDAERPLASAALSEYLKNEPQKLTELILLADNEREFVPLLEALRRSHAPPILELRRMLSEHPPEGKPEARDAFWKRQANAAVCLFGFAEQETIWPLLTDTPNPSLRGFIIDRLARLGADCGILADHLVQETDPSIQQAVILALGEFDAGKLSRQQRGNTVEQMARLYRTHSDSGIHSATAWTLRRWHEEDAIKEVDVEQRSPSSKDHRNWFVNSQAQEFVIVNGPTEFGMGEGPQPRNVTLKHRFAVAVHEVTVSNFQRFRKDHQHDAHFAPQPDCPVNGVSWYDAVEYCNWVSKQEGIPREQWCYKPNDNEEYSDGMKIPSNFLQRLGYRLPTEAEWEYVCRAKTTSAYSFGETEELLSRYAWFVFNSTNQTRSVGNLKPNGLGLFDTHGNVWEWCHDLRDAGGSDIVEQRVRNQDSRVQRGGAFSDRPVYLRSAFRSGTVPTFRFDINFAVGFRPAKTLP